jgi:hypothetical protein
MGTAVIKRIRFATRARPDNHFSSTWREAVAAALSAPPEVRPLRVVSCSVLPDVTPDHLHDGIGIEWFEDAGHLARFESWLTSPQGEDIDHLLVEVLDLGTSPVLLAEEHVLRGSEWMDERWRRGGATLKHMAIAKRAAGLTPGQFSELWKGRAGKVGTVVIPDEARGQAYVQNHPLPRPGGSWAYDALNEVYFEVDDLNGLRARIAFFADTMKTNREDDLVSESWFVVAREELL